MKLTCVGGSIEIVCLLLENGADPSVADNDGQTPQGIAIEEGDTEIEGLLREALARCSPTDPKVVSDLL